MYKWIIILIIMSADKYEKSCLSVLNNIISFVYFTIDINFKRYNEYIWLKHRFEFVAMYVLMHISLSHFFSSLAILSSMLSIEMYIHFQNLFRKNIKKEDHKKDKKIKFLMKYYPFQKIFPIVFRNLYKFEIYNT